MTTPNNDVWTAEVDAFLGADWKPTEPAGALPRVAVVGSYDAGKTTLVRRLLLDEGRPVPDWARVSAREETSVNGTVEVHGAVLVDTPGLEGLSQGHSAEANTALDTADAVLVLTTVNLFASGTSHDPIAAPTPMDVVTGRSYRESGLSYPDGALAVLVSRIDEAGPDPLDSPADFSAARDRKLSELRNLLRQQSGDEADRAMQAAVAPDPYGRTRNRIVPAGFYDPMRAWDGMDLVVAWLQALGPRTSELHAWSGIRRRARRLTAERAVLAGGLAEARQEQAAAVASGSQAKVLVDRCARDASFANENLTGALNRAVHSAGSPAGAHFAAQLKAAMQTELQRWADDVWTRLTTLAEAASLNLPEREPSEVILAAERIAGIAERPTGWHKKVTNARRQIGLLQAALSVMAGPDHAGQPKVADAGRTVLLDWLTPERANKVGHLLKVGHELASVAEQEVTARATDTEFQRMRLVEEGGKLARELFTSTAAPEGWQGIFDDLARGAGETERTWRDLTEAADAACEKVETALQHADDLLRGCPQP